MALWYQDKDCDCLQLSRLGFGLHGWTVHRQHLNYDHFNLRLDIGLDSLDLGLDCLNLGLDCLNLGLDCLVLELCCPVTLFILGITVVGIRSHLSGST